MYKTYIADYASGLTDLGFLRTNLIDNNLRRPKK